MERIDYEKAVKDAKEGIDYLHTLLRVIDEHIHSAQPSSLKDPIPVKMFDPLPLKNRLKVGTWYKYEGPLELQLDKGIVVFYKGEGVQTYGQWSHNGWLIKAEINWDLSGWAEATEDEVEEVLIAEANRRYAGKSVKYLKDPVPFESLGYKEFIPTSNSLRANYKGLLVELFRDGEWAEVADEVKCELINLDKCSKENLEQMFDQLQMELKNRK